MSKHEKVTEQQRFNFKENKRNLYLTLNEEDLKDKENHPRENEKELYFYLLSELLNILEYNIANYDYGNGEIEIHLNFDSDTEVKDIFNVLKKIKNYILYFFYIDLSSCRFIFLDDRDITLILWFEIVKEEKVFNYFSLTKENVLDDKEFDEYVIDKFDSYIVNGVTINSQDICDGSKIKKDWNIKNRKEIIKEHLKTLNNSIICGRKIKTDSLKTELKKKIFYKIPKNYLEWDEIIDILVYSLIQNNLFDSFSDVSNIYNNREIARTFGYVSAAQYWLSTQSPVFIVTKELVDLLLNIEVDENHFNSLFSYIEFILESVLFIFPENSVNYFSSSVSNKEIERLEGFEFNKKCGFIDHCFVSKRHTLIQPHSFKEPSKFIDKCNRDGVVINSENYFSKNEHILNTLSIDMITSNGVPLGTKIIIPKDKNTGEINGYIGNIERVKTFDITKLILQCVLLIISKPDEIFAIEDGDKKSNMIKLNSKGFGTIKTEKIFYPRVLNLDYVEKTVRSDDKNGKAGRGSQSPKRPHWRLGYTVDKPIGKMKGVPKEQWERKRITVKPYLVRGNADVSDNND